MRNQLFILILFLFYSTSFSQYNSNFNPDTVKVQKFDMGKMWTFENPPLDYFESEYGFKPSEKWLEKVRKSALRFGGGCSASFVSEDGLIMTNHHCARNIVAKGEKEGENFLRDGFAAINPGDERRIPDLIVEQLIVVKDVTDEILAEMSKGNSDKEKVTLKDSKISEIVVKFTEENPGLEFKVTPLYSGGKYSLYGYKKYDDVRLVFAPDLRTAKLGGDFDNFTFPRYGLDCMFFRAYENGQPVKTEFYFEWSTAGAIENEPVFVIGNPGSTDRILTMAQIEYNRDIQFPLLVNMLKDLYKIYYEKVMDGNEDNYTLIARLYSIGNSLKVYEGTYKSLLDPYLMARKQAFENQFKSAVQSNPGLNEKYGKLWDELAYSRGEFAKTIRAFFSYQLNRFYTSEHFFIASELLKIADNLEKEGNKLSEQDIESTVDRLIPANFDETFQSTLLKVKVNVITSNLPDDNPARVALLGNTPGADAVNYLLKNSKITSKSYLKDLLAGGFEGIKNSNDPFIKFVQATKDLIPVIANSNRKLNEREEIIAGLLGEALFEVYGESIPPDATFTLRIADGVVKGYDYNGTVAPYKTTFYGVLDRYFSFNKKFPFNLPKIWENLPAEFDLSKPLNFVSTNDITGGNSGSPIVNKEGKIVGLIFDGNIESMPNDYIYTTEANRAISVHSVGMLEAINNLYKATRLGTEIVTGKMPK